MCGTNFSLINTYELSTRMNFTIHLTCDGQYFQYQTAEQYFQFSTTITDSFESFESLFVRYNILIQEYVMN